MAGKKEHTKFIRVADEVHDAVRWWALKKNLSIKELTEDWICDGMAKEKAKEERAREKAMT